MYSSETQDYDIALIKLDKPFTNAQLVKPNYDPKVPVLNGLKLIVVGWGSTVFKGEMSNSLQFTRLRYIPHDECLNRFGGRYVTDSMLCAYEEGMDACQGDSGGPIITLNEDFEEILVGLVSWGVGCASSYPGVYTRLSHVADWIDETICGPNGLDPEECTLKSDHVSEPSSSPQSLEAEEKKNLVSQTNLKNSLTEDGGCHDMTTKFESKGKKKLKRSCDWVKKQLEERCDHYFVECPVTCGICGEDDEDEQKSNQ
eukprot:CAMPEP_0202443746 /NCGR_PEP_ID=MMETSP1360-20130828/2922_1 /ASSEMBLY_ACC=CAM_ASM_000848 /TAXON_ID=515479 /ORGANISM="Licmophora paradoxa, Strain CCMP2313" /LENGTH=256 /DNA_ID=CAMNT_0049059503 /DNA_START=543 /DNA_END=1313 /DNA_ORIENTATION=-